MAIDFGSVLGADTLKNFGIVQQGSMQGVKHIYYDTAQYTSGATTSLDFFNTTRSGNALNYYTNFTQNGIINPTEAFIVTGIAIAFSVKSWARIAAWSQAGVATGAFDDIHMLLFNGNLECQMAYKQYGPFPLWRIGGGGGPYGGASTAAALYGQSSATAAYNTVTWATNGLPATANIFDIVYAIPGGISFFIKLNWGTAQTLTCGDPYIKVMLDGWLLRPVA
jgi:hypothetical protein